ncbi:MAG: exodeoxyribonuclease III [Pseudomonadales bacterium]|jgi:exodeoxyribonuclease-3|nr:exodeoxyribonuclease III [Pseudomonadales bacterium]
MTKIICWNVNGLRAILRKGFVDFVGHEQADIVCLQETKTNQDLSLLLPDYQEFWSHGEKAGYSGTLILVKNDLNCQPFVIDEKYDLLLKEGRVVALEFADYILFNIYFPNGGQGPVRIKYKLDFYEQFLELTKELQRAKKNIIVCGDVNTAHQEIDLARPKANEKNTGFLPEERAWVTEYLKAGMMDVWRELHPQEVGYSWWDYKTRARDRNVGWRIDYFFVNREFFKQVKSCEILSEVMGSDHAPLSLVLN